MGITVSAKCTFVFQSVWILTGFGFVV